MPGPTTRRDPTFPTGKVGNHYGLNARVSDPVERSGRGRGGPSLISARGVTRAARARATGGRRAEMALP
jgi:hypothetical protein